MAQGALGAAGVSRVWAGAGLQRAAYRGGCILRGFPHSLVENGLKFEKKILSISLQ